MLIHNAGPDFGIGVMKQEARLQRQLDRDAASPEDPRRAELLAFQLTQTERGLSSNASIASTTSNRANDSAPQPAACRSCDGMVWLPGTCPCVVKGPL